MSSARPDIRPFARRARSRRAWMGVLLGAVGLVACDDATPPDDLPFGRTGEVRVQVETTRPKQGALGRALFQNLVWRSNGTWRLTERITYKQALGDETVHRSTGEAGPLAQRYAGFIELVNRPGGPAQLVDRLDPDLTFPCDSDRSLVTITIVDAQRADSISWSRCGGDGSLATLAAPELPPEATRPEVGIDRLIAAAQLARNYTIALDRGFGGYAYAGSTPFQTLARGEVAKAPLTVPRVIEDQSSWGAFWSQYMTGSQPAVDFTTDVVLVAAVGTRQEAGDSVEIRRVLPVTHGTQISMRERRPGDFCTPAPRVHTPFHVVIAPIADERRPIFFEADAPELVPCR
jgi:hypothetical protein